MVVEDRPHPHLKRIGNTADLLYEIHITYQQIHSYYIHLDIPTIDDTIEKITIKPPASKELRLPGKGLPVAPWSPRHGDLVVTLLVGAKMAEDYYDEQAILSNHFNGKWIASDNVLTFPIVLYRCTKQADGGQNSRIVFQG